MKAAEAFNRKLDGIRLLDPDSARVEVIPCSVYYLRGVATRRILDDMEFDDEDGEEEEYAVIVEPRIFNKFEKWNSNNGVSLLPDNWHEVVSTRTLST